MILELRVPQKPGTAFQQSQIVVFRREEPGLKRATMKIRKQRFKQDGFITRYTRETERSFLFYATAAMLIGWGLIKLFLD